MKNLITFFVILFTAVMLSACTQELNEGWEIEFSSTTSNPGVYLKTIDGAKIDINVQYLKDLEPEDVTVYCLPAGIATQDFETGEIDEPQGVAKVTLKDKEVILGHWNYKDLSDLLIMTTSDSEIKCQWVKLDADAEAGYQDFDLSLYVAFCNYSDGGTSAIVSVHDKIELIKINFNTPGTNNNLAELLFYDTSVDYIKDKYTL